MSDHLEGTDTNFIIELLSGFKIKMKMTIKVSYICKVFSDATETLPFRALIKVAFAKSTEPVATNRYVTNCVSDFLPTGCELDTEPDRHRHATVVDHMQRGHVIVLLSQHKEDLQKSRGSASGNHRHRQSMQERLDSPARKSPQGLIEIEETCVRVVRFK